MSHRITMKHGRKLYAKEQELRQMQREGQTLPKSNRRQKKYLIMVRKQKGFFKYLSERHKLHGHDEAATNFEELSKEES